MDKVEQEWIQAAIESCSRATQKDLYVLLVRKQDNNDGHDTVITNISDPELVQALVLGLREHEEDNGNSEDNE